jgi:bifunctional non-homologous end joining protein LigD
MALETYRRKRDVRATREPAGEEQAARGRSGPLTFVVQHHLATREHWDFRLELDGVLKSWAVPKVPDVKVGERRLAVQVEDHPLEYAEFEGRIPAGHYGAGTVDRWDRGTWEPVGNPHEGLRSGKLSFTLHGRKLKGAWTLVRMRAERGGKASWLLIRQRSPRRGPVRVVAASPAARKQGASPRRKTRKPGGRRGPKG